MPVQKSRLSLIFCIFFSLVLRLMKSLNEINLLHDKSKLISFSFGPKARYVINF